MTAATLGRQTFASLRNPNYRRYFSGQAISLSGTWMQSVAQSWLVLQLSGSGTALGLVVALQTLPVLFLGPYAGLVADRMDKRRLMIGLQSMMGVLALALGLLTVTGTVRLWHVFALAFLLGLNNAFENPARQAFVFEMVGPRDLRNALSLNSVLVNAARAVGPAIAGIVIAAGGLGVCFLLNAASFVAVVTSLIRLDVRLLQQPRPVERARGQLREGLRYVRHTPELAVPLIMMALIGCLAWEFQVTLPIVAKDTFGAGAQAYGFMTAAMGVGAVIGGLFVAARGTTGVRTLLVSATAFGVSIMLAALAPDLASELVAMALVGAAGVAVMAKGNGTLQLAADPSMRGRVMALWAVAFMGSTPIGGPIAGAVGEYLGGRAALGLGALACFAAATLGWWAVRRARVPEVAEPTSAAGLAESAETAGARSAA